MRILVVSDSHGSRFDFFDAVEREPTAEYIYFLGDGYREYEEIACTYGDKKACIGVGGNCDFGCTLPARDIRTIEGQRIYATHGYVERAKYGIYDLEYTARQEKCSIVLFGHTHEKLNTYRDGVYFFNPGSLRDGFYGVVDITEKGIMCIHKNLNTY